MDLCFERYCCVAKSVTQSSSRSGNEISDHLANLGAAEEDAGRNRVNANAVALIRLARWNRWDPDSSVI
jgi:hypothetical protein